MKVCLILISLLLIYSCSDSENIDEPIPPLNSEMYFPPINSNMWETVSISELGWNSAAEQDLIDYLEASDTKSFIILKNGRLVSEYYFGDTTVNSNNPWFSAGKTLSAFTTGIAQSEGLLDITNASSIYLGDGWSNLTMGQESAITIEHHLTMTTGLDYNVDFACTDPECLQYLNDPNTFWYYHNAPYTLTQSIVAGAVDSDFETYYDTKLKSKIGMQGFWFPLGYNNFYLSNARSMARFGLLCLNEGVWDDETILNDNSFFEAMTNTSQNLNPAYGYLWWLNGKSSYRLPGSETIFTGKLIPNAPDDLFAGLGANDQKLYVIPNEGLVIVRMGDDPGEGQLGPSGYDNSLWEKINALIN